MILKFHEIVSVTLVGPVRPLLEAETGLAELESRESYGDASVILKTSSNHVP